MLAFLGTQTSDRFPIPAHVDERRRDLPVERVVLRDAEVRERVDVPIAPLELGRLARPQRRLGLGLERHPGEGDEEQDDGDVHDVAAVAPAIAGEQLDECVRRRLAVLTMPGAGAPRELLGDRTEDETADADGHERPDVPNARHEQDQ